MNTNLVVLVTGFVLSRCLAVSGDPCPISWHFYQPEDVCIKAMSSLLDFRMSRRFCQRFGGDLAAIGNDGKETFLKDKYSHYVIRVGIQDFDNDGKLEHLNGIKVPAAIQQRIQNPLDNSQPEGACVTLDTSNGQLRKGPCDAGHKFICEAKRVGTAKQVTFGQPCSLNDCPCNREEWIEILGDDDDRRRLIKVNTHLASKGMAKTLCQQMGGQLLQTDDHTTMDILKDVYTENKPKDFELWFGLNEKKGIWFWDNGERVKRKIAWTGGRGSCGGVRLTSQLEWTWMKWPCMYPLSSICQATQPCQPTLTIRVGGQEITGHSEVVLTDEQHSVVECFLGGYDRLVKDVVLTCGHREEDKVDNTVRGKPYISLISKVDENVPRKRCACRVHFSDGAEMKNTVVANITFNSRPRMVNKNQNNLVFTLRKGKEVKIQFQIYANPEPKVGKLEKIGPGAFLKDSRVYLKSAGKPIHYRVTILVKDIDHNQTGIYCLAIGNRLEGQGDLKYVFALKMGPGHGSALHNEAYGLLLLPVVGAFLGTCILSSIVITMLLSHDAAVVGEDVCPTEDSIPENESNRETDGGKCYEDDVYDEQAKDYL